MRKALDKLIFNILISHIRYPNILNVVPNEYVLQTGAIRVFAQILTRVVIDIHDIAIRGIGIPYDILYRYIYIFRRS
ncbi:hypothetical protein D3C76_1427610 [compost metagenome]